MNKIDRLEKIKRERKELLSRVKDSLQNNSTNFNTNCDELLNVLKVDEESTKKYKSLIKAQELIIELTEQIKNATTQEEIIKLRNRLNYYLNKIKEEIKKRNLSQEEIEKYQEKTSYLRKDISKYLRYIKRENTLEEIDTLINKDNTSKEDKKRLGKLLSKENRYNRLNLNPKKITKIYKPNFILVGPSYRKEEIKEKIVKCTALIPISKPLVKDQTPKLDIVRADIKQSLKFKELVTDEDIISYISLRAKTIKEQYHITEPDDYNNHFFSNLVIFFKNIPTFMDNKRKIKFMKRDYCHFYHGNDLVGFIEYSHSRNSIRENLKAVLSRSYLFSKEGEYLNDHEKCASWIVNFCEKNNLDFKVFLFLVYLY